MKQQHSTCCIVGAGPAGVIAAYLLAKKGVEVLLIEAQKDFDRDFRGDTIHPSIMENLREMGLDKELLKLPHTRAEELNVRVQGKMFRMFSFRGIPSDFPYITLMPQQQFLAFMVEKCQQFDSFRVKMNTKAVGLLEEDGRIMGVELQEQGKEPQSLRCDLVIAADGRFSTIRELANIPLKKTAAPMDVLWFKLPKEQGDEQPNGAVGHLMPGNLAAQLDRGDHWQFGGILPKGSMDEFHKKGVESFQDRMIALLPKHFEARLRQLNDWKDFSLFNIECGRVQKWHRPGLLLIGDAAHIMSPVGGVGINYAIQDAIVAANILAKPLLDKTLTEKDLARVQRKRIWPTRVVQGFQGIAHNMFIKQALRPDRPLSVPWVAKIPGIRKLLARFLAFGLWRVKVKG